MCKSTTPAKKKPRRHESSIGGGDGLPELFAIVGGERPAEVQHLLQDVAGLEIGLDAREVDEAAAAELPFVEEREADSPRSFRNGLAAVAARGLPLRAFSAVDPLQASMRHAPLRSE